MILGHNINTSNGYVTASDRAVETGADVYQIFYRPAQSFQPYSRPNKDTLELAKRNRKNKLQMVIHASYLPNLCQPSDDYRHFKGVNIIVDDLNQSVKLGAMGVIIHMGNNTKNLLPYEECQANFVEGVKEILEQSDDRSTLILETGCGCGSEVSSSLKELGQIRDSLDNKEKHRVKFCLDTCHMFTYGYDLGDPDCVEFIDYEIERYLGWNNVSVIHLNDSEDMLKARKDNHADIGRGNIGIVGLMKFIHICVQKKIPIVLETPTHFYNEQRFTHKKQMEFIRSYYDMMYGTFGSHRLITDRTKSKKDLRNKIKEMDKKEKKGKIKKSL